MQLLERERLASVHAVVQSGVQAHEGVLLEVVGARQEDEDGDSPLGVLPVIVETVSAVWPCCKIHLGTLTNDHLGVHPGWAAKPGKRSRRSLPTPPLSGSPSRSSEYI